MRGIREEMNNFTTVSRLSDMDIVMIIQHCVRTFSLWAASPYDCRWIKVTHVCRQWRNAALRYPPLWTNIQIGFHPGAIEAYLQRSNPCLINVMSSPSGCHIQKYTGDTWRLLLAQSSRYLSLDGNKVPQAVPHMPAVVCLPRLRSLHDFNDEPSWLESLQPTSSLLEVVMTIYDGVWTKIRDFGSLTKLCLYRRGDKVECSLREILDGLRHLPALQHLSISFDIPEDTLQAELSQAGSAGIVSLPKLKELRMSSKPLYCAIMLANLHFPLSTRVMASHFEVCPLTSALANETVGAYIPSIPRLAGDPDVEPIVCLQIRSLSLCRRRFDSGHMNLYGWTEQPTKLQLSAFLPVELTIIKFSLDLPSQRPSYEQFCTSLPLQHTTSLHIDAQAVGTDKNDHDSQAALADFVRGITSLRELYVNDPTLSWIDTVLQPKDGECPLPNLRLLQLTYVNFTECPNLTLLPDCLNCVHVMESSLKLRSFCGSPLQQLTVSTTGHWLDRSVLPPQVRLPVFPEVSVNGLTVIVTNPYGS